LVWVVVSSFKMSGDIFSIPPTFIPKTFTIRQCIKFHDFITSVWYSCGLCFCQNQIKII
jgi:ABC-type glycerol-3-phosphate transport system permease component